MIKDLPTNYTNFRELVLTTKTPRHQEHGCMSSLTKSFLGVQGAIFQKSPLVAEGKIDGESNSFVEIERHFV